LADDFFLYDLLSEEAPPWLGPRRQGNFRKLHPLDWHKTH